MGTTRHETCYFIPDTAASGIISSKRAAWSGDKNRSTNYRHLEKIC